MVTEQFKFYQAPIQGFTDFTFRKVLFETFGGIDKFFIPYLSYGKGNEIRRPQLREVHPENNDLNNTVPQVLFSDKDELFGLIAVLTNLGYREINLNLGCPYPMATNKGRGAAWLTKPNELNILFEQLFESDCQARFSVKMRAGLTNDRDFESLIDILNRYPLEEVIFHPRTASQMYDNRANPMLFSQMLKELKHQCIYNGDIYSPADIQDLSKIWPQQNTWMIGRGLLQNPALAAQIKGEQEDPDLVRAKMKNYHDRMFDAYASRLAGDSQILMKMNQFWTYFSAQFSNQHKAMKLIKKSKNVPKYHAAVSEIFKSM